MDWPPRWGCWGARGLAGAQPRLSPAGAAGDLQQVTRLARAMVMQFGFSDLGPWNLSERGESSQVSPQMSYFCPF